MNKISIIVGIGLLATTAQAAADCTTTRVGDLNALLSNQTVCATGTGPNAGDEWQEWHQTGGTLTEYARGTDPVDPTHDVGTWSVTDNNTASAAVTHNYNGGSSFTWSVHDNTGGNYSFCDGTTEVATATLSGGQVSCGF